MEQLISVTRKLYPHNLAECKSLLCSRCVMGEYLDENTDICELRISLRMLPDLL